MIQATAAEEHPFFRFDVGNLDTLGADVGSSKSRPTDKGLTDQMDAYTPTPRTYQAPGSSCWSGSHFLVVPKKVWSLFRRNFVGKKNLFLTDGDWATDNSMF